LAESLTRRSLLTALAAGTTTSLLSVHRAAGAGPSAAVNIVSTSGTTQLVLSALLDRMGYFRRFGIDAHTVSVADGNKVVAALISGDMDLCPTSGFTQVLAAIERGAPLKILAGGAIKNFYAVVSGNPAVMSLKDLEGHSVGIGSLGSQLHQTMIALFRKYGVDASRVTFANVGASVDVFRAVKARVVDAGAVEYWLQPGSGLHILEHGRTFESLPEFVNQAAFASDRAIARKRDLLVRALAAYASAYRYIMTGDSETDFIAASATALGRADAGAARTQWQFYRDIQPFAADLVLSEERVRFMQELNVATGAQKRILPYAQVVDASLAQDALRLLARGS
jgi:ABC-type nitrate/sulfonate/bicarbonate transport system substrate-binding protein